MVRVCEPSYNTDELEAQGITVKDLAFEDGTFPPPQVVDEWFEILKQKWVVMHLFAFVFIRSFRFFFFFFFFYYFNQCVLFLLFCCHVLLACKWLIIIIIVWYLLNAPQIICTKAPIHFAYSSVAVRLFNGKSIWVTAMRCMPFVRFIANSHIHICVRNRFS